ncbi:MAG: alanyl-tRNA editing protein [Chloroflexi bacterium]|nr:alanyl-tRNA editing protein [Chloroflexota bacterium]
MLKSALPTGPAHAEVNWRRRFDHMQQHTGQHILTQAFVTTVNAATVGFHLSPDTVTIDLDNAVDISQIQQAERLANEVVFSGLAVTAREIPRGELEGVRIRRIPEHVTGDTLRVISVGDFDHTACGGTHVANSGQIGLIKVIRADRKAGKTRIEFRCGTRALEDYSQRLDITQALTSQLSTGLAEAGRKRDAASGRPQGSAASA